MDQLTKRLLARGDYIAFEHGRLVITPKSGNPIPSDWLAKNQPLILREIAEATRTPVCQYQRYSTGCYGNKLAGGVSLTYIDIASDQTGVLVFNVELTRARTTNAGAKGSKLPRGQFRVGPQYAFVRYWNRLGLALPRRLSEFHHYMGKLGDIFVTASIDRKGKMDKETTEPISIEHSFLMAAFQCVNPPDNSQASYRQFPDNSQARMTDKEMLESLTPQGLQPNSSTSSKKYEQRKQESTNYDVAITTTQPVIPTHISDWLDQMESDHQQRQLGKIDT